MEIHCSVCSGDKELFPYTFHTTHEKLELGKFPCGCNKKVCWTKDQYQIKMDRESLAKNFSPVRFVGEYKGKRSKVEYDCYDCGNSNIKSTVDFVIYRNIGCKKCAAKDLGDRGRRSLDDWKSLGVKSGVLTDTSKFYRMSNPTNFIYSCAICSVDDYVRNGLCSGLFLTNTSSLYKGHKSCRCAKYYRRTERQWIFELDRICKESPYPMMHVSREDGCSLSDMKVFRMCSKHGEFFSNSKQLLFNSTGCPECPRNSGQKQCYINLVYDNDTPVAIKYGIATDTLSRLKRVSKTSRFTLKNLGVWEMPTFYDCTTCEKEVKGIYPSVVSKSDMPDGYTETTSLRYIDNIIKIYEAYGGVRSIK